MNNNQLTIDTLVQSTLHLIDNNDDGVVYTILINKIKEVFTYRKVFDSVFFEALSLLSVDPDAVELFLRIVSYIIDNKSITNTEGKNVIAVPIIVPIAIYSELPNKKFIKINKKISWIYLNRITEELKKILKEDNLNIMWNNELIDDSLDEEDLFAINKFPDLLMKNEMIKNQSSYINNNDEGEFFYLYGSIILENLDIMRYEDIEPLLLNAENQSKFQIIAADLLNASIKSDFLRAYVGACSTFGDFLNARGSNKKLFILERHLESRFTKINEKDGTMMIYIDDLYESIQIRYFENNTCVWGFEYGMQLILSSKGVFFDDKIIYSTLVKMGFKSIKVHHSKKSDDIKSCIGSKLIKLIK